MAVSSNKFEEMHSFSYKKFTIFNDKPLGRGSYGAVYKAKCDQLPCAAKILHRTIVDPNDPGSERVLQQFRQECLFLNGIRHPHIVQYLGVCTDPDTKLPALVMELLDESLTKMLERLKHPLYYYVQVDLCHDIALEITYLHSNGIIHRDLSSNNVLVIAGKRAKVSDFGMSKLAPSKLKMTPLTLCPGTLAYMSPEALKELPKYTEKLDVFSEGVIIIQVSTRLFPDPGPAMIEVEDPRSPVGTLQVPVPEIIRRKNHIKMIDPRHPLLPLASMCLEYKGRDRPTAKMLCKQLAAFKDEVLYLESKENSIRQLNFVGNAEKEATIQEMEEMCAKKCEEKDAVITAKEQENERLRHRIRELNLRLMEDEEARLVFEQSNHQPHTQLDKMNKRLNKPSTLQGGLLGANVFSEEMQQQWSGPSPQSTLDHNKSPSPIPKFTFEWKEEKEVAPIRITRGSLVVAGNMVYFGAKSVYSYDISTKTWTTLPTCSQEWGTLAIVRGLLTIVGERTLDKQVTNKLVSLSREGGEREWVEQFPPMLTKRRKHTASSYLNHLIVAGGSTTGQAKDNIDIVEILNTDTLVWFTAASLPHPFGDAVAAICNDCLYILGGANSMYATKSVLSCWLTELLQSIDLPSAGKLNSDCVWQQTTNVPEYYSTCVCVGEQLLAVGGKDEYEAKKGDVYKYDASTSSWKRVGQLRTPRSCCHVACTGWVSPSAKLSQRSCQVTVVGGETIDDNITDSVEVAVGV